MAGEEPAEPLNPQEWLCPDVTPVPWEWCPCAGTTEEGTDPHTGTHCCLGKAEIFLILLSQGVLRSPSSTCSSSHLHFFHAPLGWDQHWIKVPGAQDAPAAAPVPGCSAGAGLHRSSVTSF